MSTSQSTQASDKLRTTLHAIESEPLNAVLTREATAFDELAAPFATKLILFGAGPMGKSALAGLRRAGVEPLAFSDNNSHLWGQEIDGLTVLPPHEAASRYSHSACFVVTIYNGSAVRCQLGLLGCQAVTPFAPLFWKFAEAFVSESYELTRFELPHRLRNGLAEIRQCDSVLHDDSSRLELSGQLAWRYWLDYDALCANLDAKHIYFPVDLVSPFDEEVFADCGSFDGPTIRSLAQHWHCRFRHAFAFEPDPANRIALARNIKGMGIEKSVTIFPCALADHTGLVPFTCAGTMGSHIGGRKDAKMVECSTLDSLDWPIAPTYIKMDIEGAELDALRGAAAVLRRYHPVLAICTYHRAEHLWEIPNLINSIAPTYRIFLRRYAEECWEGVCYAIPPHRFNSA